MNSFDTSTKFRQQNGDREWRIENETQIENKCPNVINHFYLFVTKYSIFSEMNIMKCFTHIKSNKVYNPDLKTETVKEICLKNIKQIRD